MSHLRHSTSFWRLLRSFVLLSTSSYYGPSLLRLAAWGSARKTGTKNSSILPHSENRGEIVRLFHIGTAIHGQALTCFHTAVHNINANALPHTPILCNMYTSEARARNERCQYISWQINQLNTLFFNRYKVRQWPVLRNRRHQSH